MDGVKDIAAATCKDVKEPLDVFFDIRGRGPVQNTLRIDPASPEGNIPAKVPFQTFRFHITSVDLNGIDGIDSNLNQIRDEIIDRPARMQKGMHLAVLFDVVTQHLLAGLERPTTQRLGTGSLEHFPSIVIKYLNPYPLKYSAARQINFIDFRT